MNFAISVEVLLLVAALLLFASILISKTGYRFGIPTLLMFLVAGMLFGTDGLGLQFDNVKGAQNIGMIALCIILFSGGMDTQMRDIRPVWQPGVLLSTVGVLLTTFFTGLFVYFISGWQHIGLAFCLTGSLLLAATMSSTDSASVFNILRSQRIRLKNNLRPMLELESGSNDPMAYMLTIILIACMQTGPESPGGIAWDFALQFVVGIAGGYGLGRLGVVIINRIHLKNRELYSIMVLSFIFIIYSSVYLLKGNGYLAVYIAGMVMGNHKLYKKSEITTFLDGMTWLFQIVMFVLLGLLVNPHDMLAVAGSALLVGLFMIFVARPASVFLCLLPFGRKITVKSKLFISWVGLRGAAPIIFATLPVVAGVDGGSQIFNIVFFVTLMSLLIQGMSLTLVARKLNLIDTREERADNFGFEMPEEVSGSLRELVCTAEMLETVSHIRDINLPKGVLVMMIKRDEKYLVPNGNVELKEGDRLLLISETADFEEALAANS